MAEQPIDPNKLDRETIRRVDDIERLQEIIDTLDACIRSIKAQLEYRSDDGADDLWERRAIGALSIQQTLHSEAIRRWNRLTGRTAANAEQNDRDRLAKAINRQNHIAENEQAIRRKEQKLEAARIATVNEAIRTINSARFHRNFFRIAQEELPKDLFAELVTEADASTDKSQAEILIKAGLGKLQAQPPPGEA